MFAEVADDVALADARRGAGCVFNDDEQECDDVPADEDDAGTVADDGRSGGLAEPKRLEGKRRQCFKNQGSSVCWQRLRWEEVDEGRHGSEVLRGLRVFEYHLKQSPSGYDRAGIHLRHSCLKSREEVQFKEKLMSTSIGKNKRVMTSCAMWRQKLRRTAR